ncbi:MAG: peptidoglycan binding domain-containing protein [Anaerolineae bacterium]|nr:peptidoglycan binding domain-containing protein [Anaerolineae bacterium]
MQRAAQQPVFTSQQLINTLPWVLIGVQMGLILVVVIAIVAGLGMLTFYNSERIMPGVAALGVDLGRLTVDEAAERLRAAWESDQAVLTVRDGERRWTVSPADLGLSLDAAQTAVRAAQVGRGDDGLSGAIHSLFNGRQVAPSVAVDVGRARAGFDALAAYVNLPARDADIRFNGADFQIINALPGRVIDTERMLSNLVTDPTAALAEGELNLSMVDTYPQITDVSEPLAAAQQLLGRSLTLTVYDAISDEKFDWTVASETLASWFGAGVDERRRVVLSLREEEPATYLQEMAGYLGGGAAWTWRARWRKCAPPSRIAASRPRSA